ncbi:ISL3 family transposase [Deinococcus aquatilis]|uniref:ISL3 family transposase n=1 Tax=Deinococcus aquatilis TaxID=519440 RepID=UPI0003A14263|nr:ISL3 family transposase [Deinococcus aquatilis]
MTLPAALSTLLFPGGILDAIDVQPSLDLQAIVVTATSVAPQVACPSCQTLTSSLHSHYRRTLEDLPCLGLVVHLQLSVRRFRCRNEACPRRIFCERIEGVAARSARMTQRLTRAVQDTALEIGASSGQRIGRVWGVQRSRTTSLRVMRRMTPFQPPTTIKRIGVDDFAFKRGACYGTLIIDLETGKPIEVLRDRTATTLAAWLQQHPDIELVTRDRSMEYARGLSEGAPQAQQVLDRWHLIKNLREALERQVQGHQDDVHLAFAGQGEHVVLPLRSTAAEQSSQEAFERKCALYADLYAQYQQGKSIGAIVRAADVHRATVHKAIRCQGQPLRRSHARPLGILTPFQPVLQAAWDAGCRNASQLFRDLVQAGYAGSKRRVILWAQERREVPAPTTPGRFRDSAMRNRNVASAPSQPMPMMTVKTASWLLFSLPAELEEDQSRLVERLLTCEPLRNAQELVHAFRTMVRNRQGETFSSWVERVQSSGLKNLVSFAKGLEREGSALLAALTLPYSNGPTEGAVNRLKTIKRQMYGRANFDLLRIRVLSG